MREKLDGAIKFYVEMDGRWAQLSESEKRLCDLVKKLTMTRPVYGKEKTYIIHIN